MATTLFNKTALANGTSNLIVRSAALNQSTDLVQAGVVFNDAVRASTGLFNLSGSGNQNPFLGSYTTDIHAVQNDIAAMLATPGAVTVGGQAFTLNTTDTAVLTNVQAQLGTLLTAAAQTTNAATMVAADQTLHAVQNEILQEINNDPHIAAALNNVTFMSNTGANDVGFQNTPAGADDPAALAAATAGNSLKAVGEVYNAAADALLGGINAANIGEITTDLTAVQTGLTNILNNHTMLAQIEAGETANAAALTTVHLQTMLGQIGLQLNKYDGMEANGSAEGLRGTADNILDIIDIAQNDTALNKASGGNGAAGHAGGFAEMPGNLTGTVTHFQDNQAQTNFWAAFLSEANTINAQLTAIQNGTAQASQALVTQITNYEHFGQAFDAAQGAIFEARFDNELLSGTLEADSSNAIKGLTGILNHDTGAALKADLAQINAAGAGFVADARDVSGNNMAIGGASYVGTATTVSTATSVHGLAQGTIPVTATPNIANGTGGAATTGTSTAAAAAAAAPAAAADTPAATTLFNKTALANGTSNLIVRSHALNQSTDLVQAGVVFNDAVRASTGLFNLSGSGNQNPFLGSYTTDIHAVQNDIAAMLATPGAVTLGGQAFTLNTTDTAVLTNVQAQLGTLLTAAAQTTNAATMVAADQTLHAVQNEILQEINNDPHIAAALNNVTFMSNTGANDVGFQNTPAGADDPAALAAATAGNSLKAVGEVYNAAADALLGGINAANIGEITTDLTAVQTGLTNILNNHTMLAQIEAGETANAAALTTVHLQTMLGQIGLQLNKYDGMEANGSAEGLRGTADNILDIIDIAQNDTALNKASGGNGAAGHAGGFAEMPGNLTGTVTHFQDNQAQTNFWAAFLSEANTINAQLTAIQNGTAQASQALVTQITNYEHFGQAFDAAQGAIFEARFDNELLSGTLEADSSNAIKGLTGILNHDTGAALKADLAQINAAGAGFVADARDVSGNNMAIGGASYVGTATTVSTATSVHGLAQGTIPVTATPNIANGTGGAATTGTSTGGGGGGGGGGGTGGTPPAATTLFNKTALANGTSNLIVRSHALNQSTDLVQAGVVFNDAVRASTGLFNLSGSGAQTPFLTSYLSDVHTVQNDIAAMLATPGAVTLGGQAFTLNTTDTAVLTNVESQLGTLLTAAAQTTNAATMVAADQTLHAVQNEILQEINNDPHIAAALNNVTFMATTGATDVAFQNTPAGADDPAALAAATAGSSLKAVGEVYNAAADLALGGISAANIGEITTDLSAVQTGVTNILNNHTMLAQIEAGETANAAALTTIHLQTVLTQIGLQLNKYDGMEANGSAEGLRGTADNLLDIIDIVQNDTALNMAAGGNGAAGHAGGFAEQPGGLTGTVTRFQDNQAQTNFWAAFLSEANTINAQLTAIQNGQATASQALITQIENYQHFGAAFDAAQGAIFEARFDNELLSGTLLADTNNAIKGLTGILNHDTGAALAADMAQINAAGVGFVADAKDVSGNNIPVNGGTYVGTATTVATATSINGTAQGTIPVTATPNIANGTGGTAASPPANTPTPGAPCAPVPGKGPGHDDAHQDDGPPAAPTPTQVFYEHHHSFWHH